MEDGLTIDRLMAAVKALGPKPPSYEIWALESIPRFGDNGEIVILKCSPADFGYTTVTGAEFVVLVNPITLADVVNGYVRCDTVPLAGIPVLDDTQLRDHWNNKREDGRPLPFFRLPLYPKPQWYNGP